MRNRAWGEGISDETVAGKAKTHFGLARASSQREWRGGRSEKPDLRLKAYRIVVEKSLGFNFTIE
jgi:hypothetical protein